MCAPLRLGGEERKDELKRRLSMKSDTLTNLFAKGEKELTALPEWDREEVRMKRTMLIRADESELAILYRVARAGHSGASRLELMQQELTTAAQQTLLGRIRGMVTKGVTDKITVQTDMGLGDLDHNLRDVDPLTA